MAPDDERQHQHQNSTIDNTTDLSASTSASTSNDDNEQSVRGVVPLVDYDFLKRDVRSRITNNGEIRSLVRNYRISMYAKYVDSTILNRTKYSFSDQDDIIQGWKIIGLTQRSTRRVWRNLDSSLNACHDDATFQMKQKKVLCVVINLEDSDMMDPIQHIVVHGGLDGLIGVHGAQLTEAIFMKEDSLIVEFLPFILDVVGGRKQHGFWTKSVTTPTPLGIIYNNTDLNHIGYPLDIRSVSHIDCTRKDVQIKQRITLSQCLSSRGGNNGTNRWDNRDFSVPVDAVIDILNRFVVNKPNKCSDFVRSAEDHYVLYNVNCVDDEDEEGRDDNDTTKSSSSSSSLSVHHYYRKQDWHTNKTKSSQKYWNVF